MCSIICCGTLACSTQTDTRLFRHKSPEQPLLLLYRDDPCVVIGRNQNPWKEVNIRASRRTGIPFIRRHSGGGTVYHVRLITPHVRAQSPCAPEETDEAGRGQDSGNTNFSIHLPRASFDRHATAQVILRAVRSLGIDANVNDRNDICVGKDKIRCLYRVEVFSRKANKVRVYTSQARPTRSSRTGHTTMARCSSRRDWTLSGSFFGPARLVRVRRETCPAISLKDSDAGHDGDAWRCIGTVSGVQPQAARRECPS